MKKATIIIGILLLIIGTSFIARASRPSDEWTRAYREEITRRMSERSKEYAETQPKAAREMSRCEVAQHLHERLRELNILNNKDREFIKFLESLDDRPQ